MILKLFKFFKDILRIKSEGWMNLKSSSVAIMILFCGLLFTSGCIGENKPDKKHYENNEISFEYPATWEKINSTGPTLVVDLADPETLSFFQPTGVTIIKESIKSGTLNDYIDSLPLPKTPRRKLVVDGLTACEASYVLEVSFEKSQEAYEIQENRVWVGKNGVIYTIISRALVESYDKNKANFDMIIDSFHVK